MSTANRTTSLAADLARSHRRMPIPGPIDGSHRGTEVWILFGQASIQVALFLGFGVLPLPAPMVVVAITVALAASTVLLAPHGQIGHVRLYPATVGLLWWWTMSLLWTRDPAQWWVETLSSLPIVAAVVVAGSMLPVERTVGALVGHVELTIAFQFVWIATHLGEATTNTDPLTGLTTPGWRGSFIHKNALGPYLLIALLTVLLLEHRRIARWVTTTAVAVLLAMSQSVTAWSVAAVGIAAIAWLRWYSARRGRMRAGALVPSLVIGVVALAVLSRIYPWIVDVYGKDLTFTGRTTIWASALEAIRSHPVAGHGIGGVWFRPTEEPARSILADIGFTVFHTHNGYLELLLVLGAIGLGLWSAIALGVLVAAWRLLPADRELARWALAVTLVVLLVSVSEVLAFGSWLALIALARVLVGNSTPRRGTAITTTGGT